MPHGISPVMSKAGSSFVRTVAPLKMLSLAGILCIWFVTVAHTSTVTHMEEGPCLIKRKRMTRLDPVKVGFMQKMHLTAGNPPYIARTLSIRPPIFEIPDFLSAEECDRLITVTQNHQMHASDVISADTSVTDTDADVSFVQWDSDKDGTISRAEIYNSLLYLRDLHFTDKDIDTMFIKLKLGQTQAGHLTSKEFDGRRIMSYVDQLRQSDPKIKGRHSNETWLEMDADSQLMNTLNHRKAKLTGLPLKIIEGSEPPVVVSYGPGGHYHGHYDSHSVTADQHCCHRGDENDCRICRYITIIYFLTDVEKGGQTAFPVADNATFSETAWRDATKHVSNLSSYCASANLLVTPKKGKAIMWYNHVLDGQTGWIGDLDPTSYHGGCDVIKGHKLIMNSWINVIGEDFEHLKPWRDKRERIVGYG